MMPSFSLPIVQPTRAGGSAPFSKLDLKQHFGALGSNALPEGNGVGRGGSRAYVWRN